MTGGRALARRQLLTDEERQGLFGIPADPVGLARRFILSRSDRAYARRPQTVTDHARELAAALGLRPATAADLPPMIEAAAVAARGTDAGGPIAAAVVEALRRSRVILRHPLRGIPTRLPALKPGVSRA